MNPTKNRKEVSLDNQTMAILQIQADREGRKLKNYMEHILKEKANEFEITEEYKALMDAMLDKQQNGKLNSNSWDTFKVEISR
ncbi:MAG: hypothetical protein AUK33_05450 [Flavobacteriaceae bacterium CG2_30_34_30]|nr:hypothetical protein [Flavobacteriia bacterium]OIP51126.1 MAG: hypothetical protein AUK33_05450 [Flavobacteriaceae bacterium CG2_30_34_30]PIQ16954.1 MAG: hypothetical protein COW66_13975 [Flavobacteriaceae bacterium CG18_big_fil_WC_8_21_14_2_50_34_36]PIV51653.1 MAG: hypothetical protein COS19_00600 [Flavobacteriaceae bacterium CG02_land_8_20_14_3_00_34_13]PIZ06914.1 MAG: hypothetical protein COY56_11755 [Flavobacteriaceae bacterium CG_4_10_14_0_8_um_filter_34_31]PJC07244.1 MAG: hypothetical